MNKAWSRATSVVAMAGLSACTTFDQTYHFQSRARDGSTNFFRVRVNGDAQTAKARYLAGFYDERAVDMYFNELKRPQGEEDEIRKIFPVASPTTGDNGKGSGNGGKPAGDSGNKPGAGANTADAGGKTSAASGAPKPLTPENAQGVFLMIFSTNPRAVANTIGAFADSQLVADGITNIVNRREIAAARVLTASQGAADQAATAFSEELKVLIPERPPDANTPPTWAQLQPTYDRVLEVIIRALGTQTSITSFSDARQWLGRK